MLQPHYTTALLKKANKREQAVSLRSGTGVILFSAVMLRERQDGGGRQLSNT